MSGVYTECPMCRGRAHKRALELETAIAYAKASRDFDEYARLIEEKANNGGPDPYPKESLLENSEIAMLRDGKGFYASYDARCERCGWGYEFTFSDPNMTAGLASFPPIQPKVRQSYKKGC